MIVIVIKLLVQRFKTFVIGYGLNKGISSKASNGGVNGKGKTINNIINIHNVFRMIYILYTYNNTIITLYVMLLVHCNCLFTP